MTKEVPAPYDFVDSAHRIETIAATKGGEEAVKALTALSKEYSYAVPQILDQIKKDTGGKGLTDLAAAWLHDNESVVVNSGQSLNSSDVKRTAGFIKLTGEPDALAAAMLDVCQTNFGDIAKAAGKTEKDSLTDGDLAKAVQILDQERAVAMRHEVLETDDAKMIQTLTADGGRLLKRIASINHGHDKANDYVKYKDLEEFLKLAKNNSDLFKPEEVAAVQRLKDEWYKFRQFGGMSFYVDRNSLAQGIGISGDDPSKAMDEVAKSKPTVPTPPNPIEAQVRPPAPIKKEETETPKPPKKQEAHIPPHPKKTEEAQLPTHPKKKDTTEVGMNPPGSQPAELPPARKTEIAQAIPHCKAIDDAMKIRNGEGPWACAVRLCELTKSQLTNREMLALALIIKKENPPTNGIYKSGEQMHLPPDFGSTSAGLVDMQKKLEQLA